MKKAFLILLLVRVPIFSNAQTCTPDTTKPCTAITTLVGATLPAYSPLRTPKLSVVPAYKSLETFTRACELKTAFLAFNTANINGTNQPELCPTPTFNCHGYAWYMQYFYSTNSLANNGVWIKSEDISKFWNDGSFYEIFTSPINVKGVVVYSNNDHSAATIIGSNPVRYISKWGAEYLVKHAPNDVPASYGTPSRYFILCGACETAPDMQKMTYNLGTPSTVNFVPAGGYHLFSNVPPCQLTPNINMSWTAPGNNWAVSGTKNVNVMFNLTAGQSITLMSSAPMWYL
jgi:hypothetical protein